jgi:hypothetical protein
VNDNIEKKIDTIKTLLIGLIITTAATVGLVAFIMVQWMPVAKYYNDGIKEEAAYEAEYGEENPYIDEGMSEEDLLVDENGEPIVDEDVTVTDENGDIVEGDSAETSEAGDAEEPQSGDAAQ